MFNLLKSKRMMLIKYCSYLFMVISEIYLLLLNKYKEVKDTHIYFELQYNLGRIYLEL